MAAPRTLRGLTDQVILALLDKSTRASRAAIERGVNAAIAQLRATLSASELERALRFGYLEAWLAAEPWRAMEASTFELWAGENPPTVRTHRLAAAAALDVAPVDLGDLVPPEQLALRAAQWAERHGAALVTQITESTREGVRALVDWSFRLPAGQATSVHRSSPLERALLALRDKDGNVRVGLDARRAAAFGRYVDKQAARREAGKITARKFSQLIDRRYNLLRKQRVKLIARTESSFAGNQGLLDGWRQARDVGGLQIDGLDGQFTSELEAATSPPLHPGCYCALRLVRVGGVYRVEWVTRVVNVCPRCQAMDGLVAA